MTRIIKEYRESIFKLENEIRENNKKIKEGSALKKLIQEFISEDSKKLEIIKENAERDIVLRAISIVLETKGFKRVKSVFNFHEELQTKEFDCDTGAFIYLSVGEALNYPIRLVLSPHHTFVRWDKDMKHNFLNEDPQNETDLNWEVEGYSLSDKIYTEKKEGLFYSQISKGFLSKSCYMKTLSNKEALAVAFDRLGRTYEKKYDVSHNKDELYKAIEAFTKAIELLPNWDLPYDGRSMVLSRLGKQEEAKNDNEKAQHIIFD